MRPKRTQAQRSARHKVKFGTTKLPARKYKNR